MKRGEKLKIRIKREKAAYKFLLEHNKRVLARIKEAHKKKLDKLEDDLMYLELQKDSLVKY